jgi:hypothetical protein
MPSDISFRFLVDLYPPGNAPEELGQLDSFPQIKELCLIVYTYIPDLSRVLTDGKRWLKIRVFMLIDKIYGFAKI